MALPASGAISFNNINVELGVSGTTQASLGQTSYRNLAGVASGAISMSNFYGKANQFAFTISGNQTNANLRTLAVNAGWNQSSKVVATINGGVQISSSGTGTPAMTVNGSFPGGVELINNGTIAGRGGNGGNGPYFIIVGYSEYGPMFAPARGAAGGGGGVGLSVSSAITITNNGTIAGGGGGGGGGGAGTGGYSGSGGGGGAGFSSGGAAGTDTSGAPNGGTNGGGGSFTSAGGGGTGGQYNAFGASGGAWGTGGNINTSGRPGQPVTANTWGLAGGAGSAVTGNGNISWAATGTRLGPIS
jgi:hypothetical protein